MKRIISMILVCVLAMGCVFTLAACSKATESYANKINKAAEKDKHYTHEKVMKDLDDEAIDFTVAGTGVVIAVKGCDDWDDIEDELEEGKTVKGIVITFALGKATKAIYREITEEDRKLF